MFGSSNSTFGGFGQGSAPNNGQQSTPSFGTFGTPANSSSIFGQPQQQGSGNNTGFGAFGAPNANTQTPAFGGFGTTSTPQQNTTSFGFGTSSSTPAFGSSSAGLFGSATPAATGTPAFGSQANSGMFNTVSNATSTPAFGSSGVFGASNTPVATNGTSNPPYSVYSEKEAAGSGTMNHFQSITCMPAYSGSSFEELRVQDYNQNRRYGTGTGPATGFGNGAFGGTAAVPSSSGGIFGAQQNQSSPFGQPGSANTGSIFGQAPSTQSSGLFGGNTNTTPAPFGQAQTSGLFGSNANTSTSLFGSNTANGANSTNIFGSNNNSVNNPVAFGQGNNGTPFGSQQAPTNVFGSGSNTNTSFGQANTTAAKPFSFGGTNNSGFGQTPSTNTTPNNMFGNNAGSNTNSGTTLFGQSSSGNTSSNLFNQAPTNNTSGFNFGGASNSNTANNGTNSALSFGTNPVSETNTAQKPFSFGGPTGTSNTFGGNQTNSGAGTFNFGTSSGTPSAAAPSTNLFGQNNTTIAPTNNFSFGKTNPTSGGLFGSAGGTPTSQQSGTNNSMGLFSKPASSSFFGTSTAPQANGGSNLFGGVQNQNAGNFGGTQSMFGNNQNASPFTQSQPAAQNLQSSISGAAYGNNPLFSSVQSHVGVSGSPGPIATPLVTSAVKKKPAILPHFKSMPRSPAPSPRLLTKGHSLVGASPNTATRKANFSVFDEDLLMNPEAFTPRGMKRLVIDRKSNEADLLSGGLDIKGITNGPPRTADERLSGTELRKINNSLDVKNKQQNAGVSQAVAATEDRPVRDEQVESAAPHEPSLLKPVNQPTSEGAYWTSPAMSVLLDYSKAELSKVKDLKVGRRGYGQISFLQPVDLSTLEVVEDIAGKIISFEGKMCTVYPDETMKPQPGKGLNVPAMITLEKCYPLSKDKREPIRDNDHPRFQQHIDRLRRMANTEFVDFLTDTGTWIFKVQHF